MTFEDAAGHVFESEIEWLGKEGITRGCNPPANDRFCPDDPVTRAQMAAFLTRAFDLTGGHFSFEDTALHLFETEISALAETGITRGCNPPANDLFCPDDVVTRGQMAAFLYRALDLPDGGFIFDDTAGHLFETEISALAETGITRGCNPPANNLFCPDDPLTRGQIAAFLYRALNTENTTGPGDPDDDGDPGDNGDTGDNEEEPEPADPLVIETESLPTGLIGEAYEAALVAIGGVEPYSWSATGLPDGLSIDTATGTITGSALTGTHGDHQVEITVTDSQDPAAETNETFDLTIDPEPLVLETETLPGAQVGVTYETTLTASGGVEPYTWSATGLPDGLTVDTNTGVVSGHPYLGNDGDHQVEITVTDSLVPAAEVTGTFDVGVGPPAFMRIVASIHGLGAVGSHSCGIYGGAAFCWGSNAVAELGVGYEGGQSNVPVPVSTPSYLEGKLVTDITVGEDHSCLVAEGVASCWGWGFFAQLGNGTGFSTTPRAVQELDGTTVTGITDISAGSRHTCAIVNEAAYCWGDNEYGQIGDGIYIDEPGREDVREFPRAVDTTGELAGKTVTSVSAGTAHTCVIADGRPYCWGYNDAFQLGNGDNEQINIPVAVELKNGQGEYLTVTAIAAGGDHTCAVVEGTVYCWGSNTQGQLGNSGNPTLPVQVLDSNGDVLMNVTDITAGFAHTCAIANGQAYCWGSNLDVQLGLNHSNNPVNRAEPVYTGGIMGGKTVTDISAGRDYTCAIASGEGFCWGTGHTGELGAGDIPGDRKPIPIVEPTS